MTKARDAFYERRYEECIERCQETLVALLPPLPAGGPDAPPRRPKSRRNRFLGRPRGPACRCSRPKRIAGVFTFFVRRKARFGYERGPAASPAATGGSFLQISREEAAEVLAATRRALEAVQRGAAAEA